MCTPGGDRIRLVQAHRPRNLLPEPVDVRRPEDLSRPVLVRIRGNRPVDALLLEDDLQRALCELLRACLPDTDTVEVGEHVRIRIAGDRNRGAADPGEVLQPLELPRRAPLEHLVGSLADHLPLHVLIGVLSRDVARAGLVGRRRERAHEGRLLDVGKDGHILSLADIRADPNHEVGVPLEEILLGHGSIVGWS